jgi:HD superfamily phosphohydrolase
MSEIRDPIYGFVTPSETEVDIINTSLMQRLRRIKQLAMAYLVYPGANHTRFDHSLGVFHIAYHMAGNLLSKPADEEKRRIVRLAALLHDVGHGPFSHVSEDVLEDYSSLELPKEKIHERITTRLIESDKELGKLISSQDRGKVIGLLTGYKVDISVMRDIVSGPLDADKMDYLLRDSHFCGVKYGVFDLDRMLNTLTCYTDPESQDRHIAVTHDGLNSLEQFVLAKYYMTTQVYRHKVRSVSDSMIVRGLELGIEKDGIDFLNRLYRYEETPEYLQDYLKHSDETVMNRLTSSENKGLAQEIFWRLYKRELFKKVFSERLKDMTIEDEKLRDRLINIVSKENRDLRKEIEREASKLKEIDCEEEHVIANCFTIKSVREMSRDSEGGIIMIGRDGTKRSFEKESTVFNSIDEHLKDVYFEVYAPFEYGDRKERSRKLVKIKQDITKILQSMEG